MAALYFALPGSKAELQAGPVYPSGTVARAYNIWAQKNVFPLSLLKSELNNNKIIIIYDNKYSLDYINLYTNTVVFKISIGPYRTLSGACTEGPHRDFQGSKNC